MFWQSFQWNGGVVEETRVSFLEKHSNGLLGSIGAFGQV
jgi:hypothetical protein